MMKKTLAILMALICSFSMVAAVAFAEGEEAPEAAEAYDYTNDPLVMLQMPLGVTDYANGNMVYALQNVVDEEGNAVTEDMYDDFGDPVYADATNTTLKQVEKTEIQLGEDGNPVIYLGAPCTAIYQITSGKVFALNNVPKEKVQEALRDSNGDQLLDSEGNPMFTDVKYRLSDPKGPGSVQYEGVKISAYYVVNCPSCRMANGGYSYSEIYGHNNGKCEHCGFTFPTPSDSSMKFYRFIVVDESSNVYGKFKEYDFTKAAKAVFGDSAKYYGDGVDLPQQYLTYEEVYDENASNPEGGLGYKVEVLTGFRTSGKAKNGTSATVHVLLTKIEYKFEPIYNFMGESLFVQIRANTATAFFSFIDKILSFPFT